MSDEEKLIQEFIRLRADNISFKEIKKRLSLPADFSLKQWNEKYSDEIKGLIRKNRENHKRSVSGTNLNEYEDKLKEREKQTTKDRFVSMMAKGRPKEEILEKLNLSVELFTKWSGELKNEIKLKSDIILTAKKVKQGKKRIKIFSKALLVLSAAFVIFSLTNGTPGLLQMIKSDKMSKCLRARAQMNYLTGQRLSLYPGGPVNRMRPHSRTTNRTALAEILRACEKDGFTKENTFMSVLFNTKQGKGDWIVDAADILSGSDIQSTKEKLVLLEKEKGAQIVVVTTQTVKPLTIESFANQLFNKWKIGRKKINDGVLFLIAKGDRRMRIEVGYGLEGRIPDITAKRILRDYVRPYFAAGRMSEGIKAGVDKIIAQINKENLPKPEVKQSILRFLDIKYFGPFCIVIAWFFIFIMASLRSKGILIILALTGLGVFNYFFNIHVFHELAAVYIILSVGFVVVSWGKYDNSGGAGGEGGSSRSEYDQYSYRTDYGSSSGSSYGGSDSSGSGFSGGGGESGGGGASGSW